ncbi:MAG: histidine phosphatase family protein [Patescibacteria group bacterium]
MVKKLNLHRHADKSPDNHISVTGRRQAKDEGKRYDRTYGPDGVQHIFVSPLIRTTETAYAMISGRFAFDQTAVHNAVTGLGDDEMFRQMVTAEFKDAVSHGASNLDALSVHSDEFIADLIARGEMAIRAMFDAMLDGQLGVGLFHDPTIPMLARHFGLTDARSLNSMEAITFRCSPSGVISATWPSWK